jgi:hypothetical protein
VIEEDFRFATQAQVDHYEEQDLLQRPHIAGYELTQLLDQIDERLIQHDGGRFTLFAMAPAGTAMCLAKHFVSSKKPVTLFVALARPWNDTTLAEFRTMPNVSLVNPDSSVIFEADCIVLAVRKDPLAAYDLWQGHPRMHKKSYVVSDPNRAFKTVQGGRYFLNSTIWTSP